MKKLVAMLLVMCMAMILCAPVLADTEGADMTGKKVGFSPVMMSSEFFAGMSDGMEAYFTANGMEYSSADANGDVQTQIQNLENFVQMDMDYIIMFAVDASAICDAAIAARNQGKFVINIGTVLEQRDAYDVCINVDQFDSGAVVSQMAADWIEATFPDAEDGSIEVAILEERDSDDAIRRSDGLHEIEKLTSKATVVYVAEQTITDGATKAQELADALFLQHPDVKCILTYGTDIAQGSDEIALQKVSDKDQFAIFTVDTPEFIRNKIKESADNTSLIHGTVMLGEGTPYTCYKLMDGSWMDRVVDGVYAERCIAITLDTMGEYFPE
ncbi:MAG: sugar ABC transporter substrate-binding protein [Candidatus Faecivicinus sp.]